MNILIIRWFVRVLPVLYMYLIWYQSSHFRPQTMGTDPKLRLASMGGLLENAHYIEFGILYAMLLCAALTYGAFTKNKERLALVLSILYAVLDEVHQHYVPYRSMSISDLLKDGVGIAVAFVIVRYYYRHPRSWIGRWMRKLQPDYAEGQ
jgi:VanZ family protein